MPDVDPLLIARRLQPQTGRERRGDEHGNHVHVTLLHERMFASLPDDKLPSFKRP